MLAYAEIIKLLEEKRDALGPMTAPGIDSDTSNFFPMLLESINNIHPLYGKYMEKAFQKIKDLMPITEEKLKVTHDIYNDLIDYLEGGEFFLPPPLMRGQYWLLSRMQSVGYKINEKGMCYGIQAMTIQSFLAEDMKTYNERLVDIHHLSLDDCADNFSKLRKKQQEATEPEAGRIARLIVDSSAFFDGISLNHSPISHPEIFPDIFLQDMQKTMHFTLPVTLDSDEKRPTNIASFTGAYDINELTTYLLLLQNHLGETSFSLSLHSGYGDSNQGTHAISLNYNHHTNRWLLVDPNRLPGQEYLHPELLAHKLFESYNQKHRLTMLTEIYKTAENSATSSFKILEESPIWNTLHEMSENKINQVDDSSIGQAYWAAMSGDYAWLERAITIGLKIDQARYESIVDVAFIRKDIRLLNILLRVDCCKPTADMLDASVRGNMIEAIHVLINKGIIPTEKMLEDSIIMNHPEASMALIDRGVTTTINTLHSALRHDMIEVVQYLINKGASPTKEMLESAISGRSTRSINYLINIGVTPTQQMLASALNNGQIEAANALIKNGVTPTLNMLTSAIYSAKDKVGAINVLMNNGVIPPADVLEDALRTIDITVINALIENGCPVTKKMLLTAVCCNKIDAMHALMRSGVKPTEDILESAIPRSTIAVINTLLETDIKPTEKMVEYAIQKNRIDVMHVLMDKGITPTDSMIDTAMNYYNYEAINVLIDKGFKPTEKTLESAIIYQDISLINRFVDSGVILTDAVFQSANTQREIDNYFSFQWLAAAIYDGQLNVITLLIDNGIKPDQQMLEYAVDHNQTEAIALLKDRGLIPDPEGLIQYTQTHEAKKIDSILNDTQKAADLIDDNSSDTIRDLSGASAVELESQSVVTSSNNESDVKARCFGIKDELMAIRNAHDESQELTEEKALSVFSSAHKALLAKESKFGQSLFRETKVQDDWNLKKILEHAMQSDNRSRRVCVDQRWLDKTGQIDPNAPQIIKDQLNKPPTLIS